MLQIIDITSSISLNEKIIENEMLGIINATVSHELRNPLSSLLSQNVKKSALFKLIKNKCSDDDEILEIINELEACTKI